MPTAYDRCRDALCRIRASQSSLRAFAHVADDSLLDTARELDRHPPTSLQGMPIGVKDIIDTADLPTSYGSRIYEHHRPTRDASVVSLIKSAGGLVVGKTATTEFATWPPTSVLNPRDSGRTPGGSSAGSAAAVAAGLVPVALGTQTLGSIIRPASYCGVVGFKPTFGNLPLTGVKALAGSLDTLGLLASTVPELRHVYESLLGRPQRVDAGSYRLIFFQGPYWDRATPDAQQAIVAAARRLGSSGLTVTPAGPFPHFEDITAAARLVHDFEMRCSLLIELETAPWQMDASLADGIRHAARLRPQDHSRALEFLESQRRLFSGYMRDCDAVVCLAAPGEAPLGLSSTGDPIMNIAWTALHVPCLTVPVLRADTGLPIGLQIVGTRGADALVLSIGAVIEQALS